MLEKILTILAELIVALNANTEALKASKAEAAPAGDKAPRKSSKKDDDKPADREPAPRADERREEPRRDERPRDEPKDDKKKDEARLTSLRERLAKVMQRDARNGDDFQRFLDRKLGVTRLSDVKPADYDLCDDELKYLERV